MVVLLAGRRDCADRERGRRPCHRGRRGDHRHDGYWLRQGGDDHGRLSRAHGPEPGVTRRRAGSDGHGRPLARGERGLGDALRIRLDVRRRDGGASARRERHGDSDQRVVARVDRHGGNQAGAAAERYGRRCRGDLQARHGGDADGDTQAVVPAHAAGARGHDRRTRGDAGT